MATLRWLAGLIGLGCALPCLAPGQSLRALVNQPPDGAGLTFQLTDGSVMTQGFSESDWYKLTPDSTGGYLKGTWTQLASLPAGYAPDAFASAVLADGRVVIVGGEYNQGAFVLTNMGAVYDPVQDAWTMLPPPLGWNYIGDSPSIVLPNGMFLVGRKLDDQMAVLNPATLAWTRAGHFRPLVPLMPDTAVGAEGKVDFNSEEGWTLLPDGSVLTADVSHAPTAERFLPRENKWIGAGSTGVDLHAPTTVTSGIPYGPGLIYNPPGEIGPAILRPDGTVYATGASNLGPGHSAVYHPGSHATDPGTWIAGPDFPNSDEAGDSSAVLLPNGHVLVLGNSATLYEFDGTTLIPGPSVDFNRSGNMMLLPTGQAIVTGINVQVYTSSGTYSPSWAPVITAYEKTVKRGSTYRIFGLQFNGLSQAASYGDENETATNYPLVRITNSATGHVWFARTHDHSTMGVATGSTPVFTNFDVPASAEIGDSTLQVVANGIPSVAVAITVQ